MLHTESTTAAGRLSAGTSLLRRLFSRLSSAGVFSAIGYLCGGFLLARVTFFDRYAPLGVSITAAAGKKRVAFAALGAAIGYLTAPAPVDSLKYLAAVLLMASAIFLFGATAAAEYRIFMPLCSMISLAGVGFVFVLEQGLSMEHVSLFLLELFLCAAGAWFFSEALDTPMTFPPTGAESMEALSARILMLFCLILPFSNVLLLGLLSPVRIFSVLFLLCWSRTAGAGAGAAAGLLIGALMDAQGGGSLFFAFPYALSSFFSGLFRKRDKLAFCFVFLLSCGFGSLWNPSMGQRGALLLETLLASLLFYLLPERLFSWLSLPAVQRGHLSAGWMVEEAGKRLTALSGVFEHMSESMKAPLRRQKNEENLRSLFDAAASKVCAGCTIRHLCWERDYVSTYTALNDSTGSLIERGQVDAADFPSYFASRCLHFPDFVAAVNEGAAALISRRQYKSRLMENRSIIGEQYHGVARLIRQAAEDFQKAPRLCPDLAASLLPVLEPYGVSPEITAWSDRSGRLRVKLCDTDLSGYREEMPKVLSLLSRRTGCRMALAEAASPLEEGESIQFKEAERLAVTVGVGVRKKHGEELSGDSATYFRTEEDVVHLLLSDGMGSGKAAAAASSAILRTMEQFLRAGIPAEAAVTAAGPALKLDADQRGFATLDIVSVDLTNGRCDLLKCGAAPTFVLSGDEVKTLIGRALPPGVAPARVDPDLFTFTVRPGDWVVLLSDGITSAIPEEDIAALLRSEGQTPKELSRELIHRAQKNGQAEDDMTVLVMTVKELV